MESRLDPASYALLQVFLRKVIFLLLIAVIFSFVAPRGMVLACTLLQAQAVISGAMSIALGLSAHQRLAGPTLSYWDEAVAFSAVGLLAHFGARVLA